MLPKDLAVYLWHITGKHRLPGFQGATLLSLLACNLNGHAPAAAELVGHCPHSERSTYDALADLSAPGGPVTLRAGRYVLHRFAHLLPQKDALPGPNVSEPPQSPDGETHNPREETQSNCEGKQKDREGSREFCDGSPRAEKAVGFSNGLNGNSALKALSPPDADSKTRALLCDFAKHVCRIESADAALLHALETYGATALAAALEQYLYAYTNRRREANNPAGQILAWCKKPGSMDRLPQNALTFPKWRAKLEAMRATPDPAPVPRPRENAAPEVSPEESALIQAQQLYGTGKGPKPSQELVDAAKRARIMRQSDKPNAAKAAPEAHLEGGGGPNRQS